ncbi:MAG: hypothetical protein ACJ790_07585 [Myxococcaceae bacterium]
MNRPTDEQLQKLGASMREINPSTLQQDPEEGNVRWFLGDNGTELFVWNQEQKPPHHIQLVFARVSVEWSDNRGLVTGTFSSGSSTSGGRYDAYLMHVGTYADPEVCAAALILLQASPIEESVRKALEAPLTEAMAKPLKQG